MSIRKIKKMKKILRKKRKEAKEKNNNIRYIINNIKENNIKYNKSQLVNIYKNI